MNIDLCDHCAFCVCVCVCVCLCECRCVDGCECGYGCGHGCGCVTLLNQLTYSMKFVVNVMPLKDTAMPCFFNFMLSNNSLYSGGTYF